MLFAGSLIPLFWTSGEVFPGFQSQGGSPHLHASSPACNRILRFTSGGTLADLLVASMVTKPFRSTFTELPAGCHLSCSLTICDALHIPVARIFGSKFLECPHSSFSGMLVWSTPPPKMNIWADLGTLDLSSTPLYTHTNLNLGRSWHFGFELVWSTPFPLPENLNWSFTELVCGD